MSTGILNNAEYRSVDTTSAASSLTLTAVENKTYVVTNIGSGGYGLTVNYGSDSAILLDDEKGTFLYRDSTWFFNHEAEAYRNGIPVSQTNLVCSISGKGVPAIPDGVSDYRYNKTSTDGWGSQYTSEVSLVYSDESLLATVLTPGTINAYSIVHSISTYDLNEIVFLFETSSPIINVLLYFGATLGYQSIYFEHIGGNKYKANAYLSVAGTSNIIFRVYTETFVSGDTLRITDIYIGGGSYTTPIYDHSGNGMNATNDGLLPVKYEHGIGLRANGNGAKATIDGFYTTGTQFTIVGFLKTSRPTGNMRPFGNRFVAQSGGIYANINSAGKFEIGYAKADGSVEALVLTETGIGLTEGLYPFAVSVNGYGWRGYFGDGIITMTMAEEVTPSNYEMVVGNMANTSDWYSGIITLDFYDEVLSDAGIFNLLKIPLDVDYIEKSVTASPDSYVMRDSDGSTQVYDLYAENDVSALTFTDRTPYPKDTETAIAAINSMERIADYDEYNKKKQVDHDKLHTFLKDKSGKYRDLSATVSCQNEVIKYLLNQATIFTSEMERMNAELEKLTKKE